jgi:hypothetical protein
VYRVPQTEIVCKIYAPGKLTYQLPPLGPTDLLAFHLPRLGFWILLMLKRNLEPHCNNPSSCECEYPSHLFLEISCHHYSDSFTLYFYSLCTFISLIEIMHYCISLFLEIFMYISLQYLYFHFILKKIIWISGIRAGCS